MYRPFCLFTSKREVKCFSSLLFMESAKRLANPRERILETAAALFYPHGYRAIGVDRIIAESGVAKMTFYKHFPSKDELIAAYLQRTSESYWIWLESVIAREPDPRRQLELIVSTVADQSVRQECLGCTFLAAAVEFPALDHPAHAVALDYKKRLLAKLTALAQAMNVRRPEALAAGVMLLIDGAWSAARVFGPGSYSFHLVSAAQALIAGEAQPAKF
jgi:AcrR family transcriptional regulator